LGRKHPNQHLQSPSIEAAKIGQLWNPTLRAIQAKAKQKGSDNEASLAMTRKLVAYLLAANRTLHTTGDRGGIPDGVCSCMPDLSEWLLILYRPRREDRLRSLTCFRLYLHAYRSASIETDREASFPFWDLRRNVKWGSAQECELAPI